MKYILTNQKELTTFWTDLKYNFAKQGVMSYHDINKLYIIEFLTLYEHGRR